MRHRREGIVTDLAVDVTLHIAVLVCAFGHVVERQVRNRCERVLEFFRSIFLFGRQPRNRLLQCSNFRHQSGGARVIFRALGFSNLLGKRIASRLIYLKYTDNRATPVVDRHYVGR
jgi:hypothetical protein